MTMTERTPNRLSLKVMRLNASPRTAELAAAKLAHFTPSVYNRFESQAPHLHLYLAFSLPLSLSLDILVTVRRVTHRCPVCLLSLRAFLYYRPRPTHIASPPAYRRHIIISPYAWQELLYSDRWGRGRRLLTTVAPNLLYASEPRNSISP